MPAKILEEGRVNHGMRREARRMGHVYWPVAMTRKEAQVLSDPAGARARILQGEVHRLRELVGEKAQQTQTDMLRLQEMSELGDLVASRRSSVRVDVSGLSDLLASTGQQLRIDLEEASDQVAQGLRALQAGLELLRGRLVAAV